MVKIHCEDTKCKFNKNGSCDNETVYLTRSQYGARRFQNINCKSRKENPRKGIFIRELDYKRRVETQREAFNEYIHDDNSKDIRKKLRNICNAIMEYQTDKHWNTEKCSFDIEKIICPKCLNNMFKTYSYTDEHDTYEGMRCQYCGFDYSATH